jgi:hypothetical protein
LRLGSYRGEHGEAQGKGGGNAQFQEHFFHGTWVCKGTTLFLFANAMIRQKMPLKAKKGCFLVFLSR